MDGPRFDLLTMALTTETGKRRLVLRLLAGGTLAVLLARLGRGAAGAACRKVGKPCIKRGRCCPGARCKSGKCRCKARLKNCGGRCYNLQTATAHCGACGAACTGGQTCQGGSCDCPSGQRDCNGTCQECCDHPDCRPDQQCDFFGACICPGQTRECDGRCVQATCCTTAECSGSEQCVGGVCQVPPVICSLNPSDPCTIGEGVRCDAAGDNDDCLCATTRAGAVACGKMLGTVCHQCTVDADCAGFGAGWFCFGCGACSGGGTACAPPCPNPA